LLQVCLLGEFMLSHKDVEEYYYIIHGWCVYYYRTYILGVGVGFYEYFTYHVVL